jgi:two-component system CheB/CheR fusion protein
MNLYRMAKEELKYVLSNAIHQARATKNEVYIEDIKLKEEQNIRLVNIRINILENTPLQGLMLVIFEDKGVLVKSDKKSGKKTQNNVAVEELEKELIYTKQQLHTTIEQMETSLEELKSTNEELQSTNEELQSTNEEALTTKEEMQSLNEELMTINVQYQSKAEELTQVNNDMKNMLDNTEIGTIFLDTNLEILRYTPQITKIFNVIPSDLGRSITHIVSNFDSDTNVEEEIKKVIDTLSVKEFEVKTKNGEWFNLRIMPYRTTDNFISGAVLTIYKITSLKVLESQVTTLNSLAEVHLNGLKKIALLTDKNFNIIVANAAFCESFQTRPQELRGMSFQKMAQKKWHNVELNAFLQKNASLTEKSVAEFNINALTSRSLKLTIDPLINKNTKETSSLLIVIET